MTLFPTFIKSPKTESNGLTKGLSRTVKCKGGRHALLQTGCRVFPP